MLTVSLQEFLALVEKRHAADSSTRREKRSHREKVLRNDQIARPATAAGQRRLDTCPQCDAVVDSEIIHPHSGLCPICHDEAHHQR